MSGLYVSYTAATLSSRLEETYLTDALGGEAEEGLDRNPLADRGLSGGP